MMYSSWIVKFASEEVVDRFLANVDVWKTIFKMLSVKDRIRVEMTNKRLGILMFDYWKRVTSFDTKYELKSDSFSMSKKSKQNRERLTAVLVTICVNRIGDGLRSLTIREYFPSTLWSATLPSIGERCPNIETINFVMEDKDPTLYNIRLDSFSRLKTLTVTAADRDFTGASAFVFLSTPASIEVIHGLMAWQNLGSYCMSLPTVAIEALANGCPKLRDLRFRVSVGEATPASIRYLIDCIVAHPSWIHQTDQPTLEMEIDVWGPDVWPGGGDEHEVEAGRAAFSALAAPAANLPSGVQVKIWAH